MQFIHFLGVDVSKEVLDICVVKDGKKVGHFQISNTQKAVRSFLKELQKIECFDLKTSLFCLEFTGIYCNPMLNVLKVEKANVWMEKAIQIQKSSGLQRGKSDQIDAERIALFAWRHQDKIRLWAAPRIVIDKLKKLLGVRKRLILSLHAIEKPIKESKKFDNKEVYQILKASCRKAIASIKSDIKLVEKNIKNTITDDTSLKKLYSLLTSVDGIGSIIACQMIITTNEFISIKDPKKYACYAGVVPFEHRSGSSVRGRHRVSHFANKEIKSLLHMAAINSIRYSHDLREYYLRKVAEGKHKLTIINAMKNKIIQRAFAVINRGSKYEKIYINPLA